MAASLRIGFAKSAEDDLLDIVSWYSSQQQAPEVGERLVGAVVEHVEQIAMFPDSGKIVPEFETPWLREREMPPFRIVYRRDEALVTVVRVWRSERLMDTDLGGTPDKRIPQVRQALD